MQGDKMRTAKCRIESGLENFVCYPFTASDSPSNRRFVASLMTPLRNLLNSPLDKTQLMHTSVVKISPSLHGEVCTSPLCAPKSPCIGRITWRNMSIFIRNRAHRTEKPIPLRLIGMGMSAPLQVAALAAICLKILILKRRQHAFAFNCQFQRVADQPQKQLPR